MLVQGFSRTNCRTNWKRGRVAEGWVKPRAHIKILTLLVATMLLVAGIACTKKSDNAQSAIPGKHYQIKGKVVSIDQRGKMVNIDSEAIPGFMEEMTMPYQVKPESELDKLHPGDQITADLVVQDESAWLQKISVISHSAPPASN